MPVVKITPSCIYTEIRLGLVKVTSLNNNGVENFNTRIASCGKTGIGT